MIVDTHCHLDFDWFDDDRDAVVARAVEAGVKRIVVPAIDLGNCRVVLELADTYEPVYAAVGVHPNSSAGWKDQWADELKELAGHEKVVAIGEIGLDYYRDRSPRSVQQRAFSMQLALAAELELPVIVHNRQSSEDVIHLLAKSALNGRERPGVLHSFSADVATAQAALDMGFYLGVTGPVTYKRADDLRRILMDAPTDRVLVETDAPFLAPQQYRGRRNEPAYMRLVVEKLASMYGIESKEIARQTSENAIRLFGGQLR
jgi:TatD DNase family protein